MDTESITVHNDTDYPINPFCPKNFYQTTPATAAAAAADTIDRNDNTTPLFSDVETSAFRSCSYTSLRDLMASSPLSLASPVSSRMDRWREMPIKDPLLKFAAWAYLRPIGDTLHAVRRSPAEKFKDDCRRVFSCFYDVLQVIGGKCLFPKSEESEGDD